MPEKTVAHRAIADKDAHIRELEASHAEAALRSKREISRLEEELMAAVSELRDTKR